MRTNIKLQLRMEFNKAKGSKTTNQIYSKSVNKTK